MGPVVCKRKMFREISGRSPVRHAEREAPVHSSPGGSEFLRPGSRPTVLARSSRPRTGPRPGRMIDPPWPASVTRPRSSPDEPAKSTEGRTGESYPDRIKRTRPRRQVASASIAASTASVNSAATTCEASGPLRRGSSGRSSSRVVAVPRAAATVAGEESPRSTTGAVVSSSRIVPMAWPSAMAAPVELRGRPPGRRLRDAHRAAHRRDVARHRPPRERAPALQGAGSDEGMPADSPTEGQFPPVGSQFSLVRLDDVCRQGSIPEYFSKFLLAVDLWCDFAVEIGSK